MHFGGRTYHVEDVGALSSRLRMDYHERHLRPGGTISGPSMMALADLALYAALLAQIGPVALAVTTNLSFNFLRKPAQRALIAECRLLKVGKAARGRGSPDDVGRGGSGRLPGDRNLFDPRASKLSGIIVPQSQKPL